MYVCVSYDIRMICVIKIYHFYSRSLAKGQNFYLLLPISQNKQFPFIPQYKDSVIFRHGPNVMEYMISSVHNTQYEVRIAK